MRKPLEAISLRTNNYYGSVHIVIKYGSLRVAESILAALSLMLNIKARIDFAVELISTHLRTTTSVLAAQSVQSILSVKN